MAITHTDTKITFSVEGTLTETAIEEFEELIGKFFLELKKEVSDVDYEVEVYSE